MSSLKYRPIGLFPNMELVSVKSIPGDEKQQKRPKIQLNFASPVRLGQGTSIKIKGAEFAKEAEIFWKCKVTPELFKLLSSIGVKKGSICSIKASVDNWGSQEAGGTWFEFIELVTLNGQEVNFKSPYIQDSNREKEEDNLEEIEDEINSELTTYGY